MPISAKESTAAKESGEEGRSQKAKRAYRLFERCIEAADRHISCKFLATLCSLVVFPSKTATRNRHRLQRCKPWPEVEALRMRDHRHDRRGSAGAGTARPPGAASSLGVCEYVVVIPCKEALITPHVCDYVRVVPKIRGKEFSIR